MIRRESALEESDSESEVHVTQKTAGMRKERGFQEQPLMPEGHDLPVPNTIRVKLVTPRTWVPGTQGGESLL